MSRRSWWFVVAMFALLVAPACARSETAVLEAERSEDAVTDTLAPTESAESTESAGDTVTAAHPDVPLTAAVPRSWTDIEGTGWIVGEGDGEEIGQTVVAAPDIDAFYDAFEAGWQTPGVFVGTSDRLLDYEGIDTGDAGPFAVAWAEYVGRIDYDDDSCRYEGVSDVSVGQAFGLHRVWTGCGSGEATVADFWTANRATGRVVQAVAVVPGSAEVDAVRRILSSIRYGADPVVEIDQS